MEVGRERGEDSIIAGMPNSPQSIVHGCSSAVGDGGGRGRGEERRGEGIGRKGGRGGRKGEFRVLHRRHLPIFALCIIAKASLILYFPLRGRNAIQIRKGELLRAQRKRRRLHYPPGERITLKVACMQCGPDLAALPYLGIREGNRNTKLPIFLLFFRRDMREEIVSPVGGPPGVFMDDLQICVILFLFFPLLLCFFLFYIRFPFLFRVVISSTRF